MKKIVLGTALTGLTTFAYMRNRVTADTNNISEDRWVTVYVWRSKRASGDITSAPKATLKITLKHENANVGHVSLETSDKTYISYWPARGGQIKEAVPATYMPNLEKDILNEGTPPDLIARFYSLDNRAIEAQILRQQENTDGWALKGPVKQNEYRGHSCASYVCAILEAGNFYGLTTHTKKISPVTPNSVADLVIAAKIAEREHFPITVKWENALRIDTELSNSNTVQHRA